MPVQPAGRQGVASSLRLGPTGERWRIVAGNLAAPPLRPAIVDRPALISHLCSTADVLVVLVSAPAPTGGCGR